MATTPSAPAFLLAGCEFRIGTAPWWGDAIISPDAIFLLQTRPAKLRSYLAIAEQLVDRVLPSRTLPAKPYAAIPESVRGDAQWPARRDSYRGALIVPRRAVPFLYHERGKLDVRFVFDGVEIAIVHGRFGGRRVRAFAAAAGWPLFWDGVAANVPGRSEQQLRADAVALRLRRRHVSHVVIAAGFVLGTVPMSLELVPGLNRDLVSTLWGTGWIVGVALVLFGYLALRRGF